jgi:hypothetical protein
MKEIVLGEKMKETVIRIIIGVCMVAWLFGIWIAFSIGWFNYIGLWKFPAWIGALLVGWAAIVFGLHELLEFLASKL